MKKPESDNQLARASTKGVNSIIGYIGYISAVFLSFVQGWYTRYALLPVYPYSQPRAVGWIGPGSFLAVFGTIGGLVIRKNQNPFQKRRNLKYLVFSIAGITVFVIGLVFGLKNTQIFSVGVDYGVYSQKKYD